jgi:hypothetical protein
MGQPRNKNCRNIPNIIYNSVFFLESKKYLDAKNLEIFSEPVNNFV